MLQTAKNNVATAQQALDAAQAAATAENPNDAAIKQAESQLAKAQQEEQAAQQKLDAAPAIVSKTNTTVPESCMKRTLSGRAASLKSLKCEWLKKVYN